jgi:hypothetical protein
MNDPSFPYRLALGLSFFVVMGLWDYYRHRENPKRLKEYIFLFSITLAAMAYGIVHDAVTYTISPAYYVIGKGLHLAADGFNRDVVYLAMKATWTAGLIGGAAFLIANNPDKHGRQLKYGRLLRFAFIPFGASLCVEILLGALCYCFADTINVKLPENAFGQPVDARFIAVWGMHFGAYGGGIVGLIAALIIIIRTKRKVYDAT